MESFRIAKFVAADMRSFFELLYICGLAYVDRRRTMLRRLFLCLIPGIFLQSARGEMPWIRLKCRGEIFDVTFPNDASTEFWSIRSTLAEVLVNAVYRPRGKDPVRCVVDAGANYGLASLYLSTFFPEAEFICFEPSSSTFKVLKKNLDANGIRGCAIRKAVSDVDGVAQFELERSSMERQLLPRAMSDAPATEPVETVSLADEMRRIGTSRIDFLKFDVEGQELELLAGLGEMLGEINEIIGETHDAVLTDAARKKLESVGFNVDEKNGHLYAHSNIRRKKGELDCV